MSVFFGLANKTQAIWLHTYIQKNLLPAANFVTHNFLHIIYFFLSRYQHERSTLMIFNGVKEIFDDDSQKFET